MNFLQKLSNYFFGKPKIEANPAPVAQAEPPKHIVTPIFIRPEDTKQEVAPQPAPQTPVEYPPKEIKIEIKDAAPEATFTISTSTVEVAPEPKKKRAPAKKKSTPKKK